MRRLETVDYETRQLKRLCAPAGSAPSLCRRGDRRLLSGAEDQCDRRRVDAGVIPSVAKRSPRVSGSRDCLPSIAIVPMWRERTLAIGREQQLDDPPRAQPACSRPATRVSASASRTPAAAVSPHRAAPRPTRRRGRGAATCGPPGRCSSPARVARRIVVVQLGCQVSDHVRYRSPRRSNRHALPLANTREPAPAARDLQSRWCGNRA